MIWLVELAADFVLNSIHSFVQKPFHILYSLHSTHSKYNIFICAHFSVRIKCVYVWKCALLCGGHKKKPWININRRFLNFSLCFPFCTQTQTHTRIIHEPQTIIYLWPYVFTEWMLLFRISNTLSNQLLNQNNMMLSTWIFSEFGC